MLEKFTYKNHNGQLLTFGSDGIYANYSDLYDYAWSYDIENRKIKNIYREPVKKTIPVIFVGLTGEACRKARMNFFEAVEADVLAEQKGVLTVGNYSLNCYLMGTKNSSYLETERMIKTEYTLVTDDPVWRKTELYQYPKTSSSVSTVDKDYPYNYPYNYVGKSFTSLTNSFKLGTSHIITIYGPAESPQITINGNVYGINGTIEANEQFIINSADKSVIKICSDRTQLNYLGYRYKANSCFKEIPYGKVSVLWSGEFGFDLKLIETRSEPNWAYTKVSTDDIDGIIDTDTGVYLVDSSGNILVDADGDLIIVEV